MGNTQSLDYNLSEQKKKFARKAFRVFALNSVLSSVGVSLSTTVDALIVGNAFGENGLAVTSVVMPVYMLMNLISIALGVGASIGVSNAFGKDDTEQANRIFSNAFWAGLGIGLILAIFGTIFIRPLVAVLGGSILGEGCVIYVGIVVASAPLFIIPPLLDMILRSDADPLLSSVGIVVSSVVNLLLDLFFIFVLKVGIFGAAIAMVIGQASAIIVYSIHFFKKTSNLKIELKKPDFKSMIDSFAGGFGSASYYIWMCIYIIVFNNVMSIVAGEPGIAVFNLIFNVSLFAFAVFDGISATMPSLIGTFLGEKDNDSVLFTAKISLKTAFVLSLLISVFLILFAPFVVSIFGLSTPEALDDAIIAVRIYSASIIGVCLNSILLNYYQTMGYEKLAAAVNAMRGFIVLIGFGVPLIFTFGIVGIPLSIFSAEYLTLAFLLVYVSFLRKKKDLTDLYMIPKNNEDSAVYEVVLDKDFERLPEIVDAVSEFCDTNEINPKTAYYINLTIEELAANIIQFGFNDNKPHFIAIKVAKYDENVFVRIRDDATGYNPFDVKKKDGDENFEMDFMGVDLVKNIALQFIYQRKLIFNNLLIIL